MIVMTSLGSFQKGIIIVKIFGTEWRKQELFVPGDKWFKC